MNMEVAENAIKHVVTRASTMLATAGIHVGFWPKAVRCALFLKNHSPHCSISKTPYEAYHNKVPKLSHIRIFSSLCYAHLEKDNRQKLDSHTIECGFMGYYATKNLFAMFYVNKRVMLKKRDMVFFEYNLGHPTMTQYGLASECNLLVFPIDDIFNK